MRQHISPGRVCLMDKSGPPLNRPMVSRPLAPARDSRAASVSRLNLTLPYLRSQPEPAIRKIGWHFVLNYRKSVEQQATLGGGIHWTAPANTSAFSGCQNTPLKDSHF